jgi:hypothetical protein
MMNASIAKHVIHNGLLRNVVYVAKNVALLSYHVYACTDGKDIVNLLNKSQSMILKPDKKPSA